MNRYRYMIVSALALILSLALCLGGCGSSKPTTEEIQKQMTAMLDQAAVYRMDSSLEAKYRSAEETEETTVYLTAATQVDRANRISDTEYSLKTVNGVDAKSSKCRFVEEETDQGVNRYVYTEDSWTKEINVAASGLPVLDLLKRISEYRDVMLLYSDEAKIGGIVCYELKAYMAPMDLVSLMRDVYSFDAEQQSLFAEASIPENTMVTATLYVNTDTMKLERLLVEAAPQKAANSDTADGESESEDESEEDAVEQVLGTILPGMFNDTSLDMTSMTLKVDFDYPEDMSLAVPGELETVEEPTEAEEPEEETKPEEQLPEFENLTILTQYAPKFYVLCGNEEIRVYLTRIALTRDDGLLVNLNLVNDSDQDMDLYAESAAVNRTMFADVTFYEKVGAHESRECYLLIEHLSQQGITDVGSITVRFVADDANMNQELFETKESHYVIREEYEGYVVPETETSQVIYEDEHVRITTFDTIEGEKMLEIPMFVENLTDSYIGLSTVKVMDEGGQTLDMKLYGNMLPHSCMYTKMSLNLDYIDSILKQMPREIHTSLTAYDLYQMTSVFTTDEIVIRCVEDETEGAETEAAEETVGIEETAEEETEAVEAEVDDAVAEGSKASAEDE